MAEMWISMGPQHPMTHGLWTLKIKVDGETVIDTEPDLGYIHRGVEKICEARDFTQITTYCDRLCYASANTWSHSYIYAVEDLLEVEVPERAEYIRLIAVELQRIASHLMWLGAYGPDIGNLSVLVWCLRERELMMDLLQELGGSRMHYNFPRIGGVKRDLPHGFAQRARAKVSLFLNRIQEYEALFDESTIFLIRTQGVGYSKAEDMVNHGVTGPNLRAGGVNYDVRTSHPYSVYSELDWEVPVERPSVKGADCYDRYRIRVEEMRISAMMVLEALDKIPPRGRHLPRAGGPCDPGQGTEQGQGGNFRITPLRGQPRGVVVLHSRGRRRQGEEPVQGIHPLSDVPHDTLRLEVHGGLQGG